MLAPTCVKGEGAVGGACLAACDANTTGTQSAAPRSTTNPKFMTCKYLSRHPLQHVSLFLPGDLNNPAYSQYLDFMNILSYDYHSAFEPSVNHHSPLFPLEEDSEYNFDSQLSIDYTINHYLKLGADRDKLVLGIPTYGRSYTLFNPLANEVGAPADGPGEQGDATREKGYLAYYERDANLKRATDDLT
ncbi:unnamed protein product [Timema podura]|uniref:GH18 domain-containing protein n=1 Tax=Timema podura TaxID=61482 RepID=A0ABN7PBK5_TIMPD|nr:unnamed protein product [Timema podura]